MIISMLFMMLFVLIGWGVILGGLSRYLSSLIFMMIASIGLSLFLGVLIYEWVEGRPHLNFTDILSLMAHMGDKTIAAKHFLWSEFAGFSLIFMVLGFLFFEEFRPSNKVLGNAHFANGLEIHKAGFYTQKPESLIIGKKGGLPLYSNHFEHVLVFAPSGSGKTRSIAIPNLFHFPYSVVCNDIKFSLFETTSGYRKEVLGHECYCFAPTRKSGITHRYNPLDSISQDPLARITDIQQIAHIFIPDNPKEQVIWTQASRKLFKTLMLYLLDSEDHLTTLGAVNRLVKQENFDSWLQDLLDNTDHFDPEFYRNGYSYLNNHAKTRQGIIETFSGYFELFDDPFVDAATSASDFSFTDLRRKKMTIYVGFTDEDMERLAPLLTLFWQQLISSQIKEIPDPIKEPYPLLCLIDEFSSLGRIERLRRSLKLLREYRVRCILMFQYIAQTYEKYSHDEAKAFINIKTKVAYTTEDINDAEFISKMLGTRTKKVVSRSVTSQNNGSSNGKSISYQAIPLMRPDEIMKMPAHITLIMRSGFAPVKARQFIWYKESVMKHLVMTEVFVPKQIAKQRPFVRRSLRDEDSSILSFESLD
jgi:type IV secretion system protein VirD4